MANEMIAIIDGGQVLFLVFGAPIWIASLLVAASGLRLRTIGRPLWRSEKVDALVTAHVKLLDHKELVHLIEYVPTDSLRTYRVVELPIRGQRPLAIGKAVRVSHSVDDVSISKRYSNWRRVLGWLMVLLGMTLTGLIAVLLRPTAIVLFGALALIAVTIRLRSERRLSEWLTYRKIDAATSEWLAGEWGKEVTANEPVRTSIRPPAPRSDAHRDGYRRFARFASLGVLALVVVDSSQGTNFWVALSVPVVMAAIAVSMLSFDRLPDGEARFGTVVDYAERRNEDGVSYYPIVEFTNGSTVLRFVSSRATSTKRFADGSTVEVSFRPGNSPKARLIEDTKGPGRFLAFFGVAWGIGMALFASWFTALSVVAALVAIWWFRERVSINTASPANVVRARSKTGPIRAD